MIKISNYDGKTLEEAKEKAFNELNLKEDNLIIEEEFIEGKLFKSSKYEIKVIEKTDVKNEIAEYLEILGNLMSIKINTEIKIIENNFNVLIISDKNAILIGKEGKNIDSLQTIMRQVIKKETNMNIKVNVDVANYKVNKIKNLEYQIKKIAKEVLNTKIDTSLDRMNSYERRSIHTLLDKWENIETESIGEGKERHIIIKYVEEKK